ncbi:hypothetical protein [Micromonospora endophytica]|uniref:Uncharacterized protein n=1 Tax=Micromonospora endophytica TaxID=515350 RepID=A0A2W2D489_9ACTN|nr:hypothetical protein [Micromonospora endophytica]PZG00415.1 hypothetical protein C1I93_02660 [Micromonospora endophytica]RIW47739.1 hypothetical protein D3H59_09565 [Micromonospora endophytica]
MRAPTRPAGRNPPVGSTRADARFLFSRGPASVPDLVAIRRSAAEQQISYAAQSEGCLRSMSRLG